MLPKYTLGLDLGQQNDYTVLTVVENSLNSSSNIGGYLVPYVRKYALRTDYTAIVSSVASFVRIPELRNNYILIIDYTGVGRPVVDLFRRSKLQPIAVNITGGASVHWPDRRTANVPKKEIVSALQVAFQCDKLKIASDLKLLKDLTNEFLSFTARSSKGKNTYEAASGAHDDIVMSLGLAIWYGEYKSRPGSGVRIIGGN